MKTRRLMTAKGTAIVLSLVMTFTVFPMSASAEEAAAESAEDLNFVPGQLIVVTEQNTSKKQIKSIVKEVDGQMDTISELGDDLNVALIEVEEGSELSTAAELECEDDVLFVQPNYKYEFEEGEDADGYPNDPKYTSGEQCYLAPPETDGSNAGTANAKGAWDQLAELDNTTKPLVAVIDSGARITHEDLEGVIDENKCVTFNYGEQIGFTEGDNSYDDAGHGTKVTGIIGANINNGKGIAGVAGNNVEMFVVDVGIPEEGTYTIDVAKGIEYATNQGANLINMSLGTYGRDYLTERAMKYAWENGTLCICSAGNGYYDAREGKYSASNLMHYPGDSLYAVTVMAHNWDGVSLQISNYGIDKDLSAPGINLSSIGNTSDSEYTTFNNTSSATPVVTGTAALLLAADSNLTPRQIKNLLYTSTGRESFSAEEGGQGFGRINTDAAMRNLLAEKTAPERIVINRQSIDLFTGETAGIEYAVYPGNTNNTDVTFTSKNENIAKVNEGGMVYAMAPGHTTITVKCGNISAKCNVTVSKIPYKTINHKPCRITENISMDEPTDTVETVDNNGTILDEFGYYYHQYRIDLEENETINTVMTMVYGSPFLNIRDKDGSIVASSSKEPGNNSHTMVTYTAEKTGTYLIQTIWRKPTGGTEATYRIVLASDKSFCEPAVKSKEDGQMCMTWPAIEDADCYIVRKYADKDMTEVEFEETVTETKFTDTSYDGSKVNYYTVTACTNWRDGVFCNGETPFVVKLDNPVSATGKTVKVKYKTLKKRSVTRSRAKAIKFTNDLKDKKTYKLLSAKKGKKSFKKYFRIYKKTGKVRIKKGLKKGTYKVKVRVKAAGNEEYNAITNTVTFRARVR